VMHFICDGCGEAVGCVNCVHLCVVCVQAPELGTPPKKSQK
jgi:hypothetical protein